VLQDSADEMARYLCKDAPRQRIIDSDWTKLVLTDCVHKGVYRQRDVRLCGCEKVQGGARCWAGVDTGAAHPGW